MNISEKQLATICKFICWRYERDSHYQMRSFCSRPKYKKGFEPECNFQCCKEEEE